MVEKCDVSVIIPNFNRSHFLARALNSICQQEALPMEVIIVDDKSDDDEFQKIQEYIIEFNKKIDIKFFRNPINMGANYCRNLGISHVESKYIAFLDSDDFWLPGKLRAQMQEIYRQKSLSTKPILSATARYRISGNGELIASQFGKSKFSPERIRRSNFIGTLSSIVVDAWVARHIGGFDTTLRACQDWDFFIRLSDYVDYVGVSEPLTIYVDHDEQRITLNNTKRLSSHIHIYKKYIKDDIDEFEKSEFYRNLAEDFQMIGNRNKFLLYYSKHKATKIIRSEKLLSCLTFLYFHYFKITSKKSIKEKRYAQYARNLRKIDKKVLDLAAEQIEPLYEFRFLKDKSY